MVSRPNSHRSPLFVLDPLTLLEELAKVFESAGTIGIRKYGVLAPDMPHAVSNCAPFPSVLLQCDYSYRRGCVSVKRTSEF